MLTLRRAVRIKDEAELPSGERIVINCNLEQVLTEFIEAYSDAFSASEAMKEKKTKSSIDYFYECYAKCLKIVFGVDNWKKLEAEFDADVSEICDAMAQWFTETVIPAIGEASKRRMQQKKKVLK